MSMMDQAMSAGQSYYYENRQFLLKTIMNQLGLTDSDLEKNPSEIKQIVREANIDTIVND
jgi:predicted RND superfamily exporter protein